MAKNEYGYCFGCGDATKVETRLLVLCPKCERLYQRIVGKMLEVTRPAEAVEPVAPVKRPRGRPRKDRSLLTPPVPQLHKRLDDETTFADIFHKDKIERKVIATFDLEGYRCDVRRSADYDYAFTLTYGDMPTPSAVGRPVEDFDQNKILAEAKEWAAKQISRLDNEHKTARQTAKEILD